MYEKIRSLLIGAVIVAVTAASAQAAPITLFTDQITKIKYTNFENLIDINQNGIIDAGDKFEGILVATSVTDVNGSIHSDYLLNKELTGAFQISIIGGSIPVGGTGHVDFALNDGDYINFYVDTNPLTKFDYSVANAINGDLWASIGKYEGINDTVWVPALGNISVNRNWADFGTNNTGYTFSSLQYPEAIPLPDQVFHSYLELPHIAGHLNEIYFSSTITDYNKDGWRFKSEDPLYVSAVPEPGTLLLVGAGLAGLAIVKKRRGKK